MKVIQIATVITPDGAYGGPIRVAVNQVRGLLKAGHDVTLAAGAMGFDGELPKEYDGVPVKLFPVHRMFPGHSFSSLWSPGLHRWLKTEATNADLIHLHLARDLVTLPAALIASRAGIPYVVQTHGMIVPSHHPLSTPLDFLMTRRALLGAERIFFLTPREKTSLVDVARRNLPVVALHNGVPIPSKDYDGELPAIEVLFLARLHTRKRPLIFVEMAIELHKRFPEVKFRMVGPDEGEGPVVLKAIEDSGIGDATEWEGPLSPDRTVARMRHASLYVLPSIDEPFPMSVLEAMSLGVPVVITDSCGLADVVNVTNSGAVVDHHLESLISAVAQFLEEPGRLRTAGRNAAEAVEQNFSIDAVVHHLEANYAASIRNSRADKVGSPSESE